VEGHAQVAVEVEFDPWVERSATPPELRAVLATLLTQAPARLRDAFAVRTQPIRFTLPKAVFLAVRR
jgi:hypothetical protein